MNEIKLGKLEKIKDLRSIWKNEEYDFTPWLAREQNIKLLSDELGISIKVLKTEASVGKYSLDILAVNEDTNENIIIENQLEITNHDHLGKVLVYGAGYDAKTIIWIVKDYNEEHKQAIEWLNEHSDENINLFLVKIELFKIGNSEIAPHFEIISQPNDWTKTIRSNQSNTELTGMKLVDLNFWQGFSEYLSDNRTTFSIRKAQPQHWYSLAIGSSDCHIDLTVNKNGEVACSLWIENNKSLYNKFFEHKNEIETELGYSVKWDYKEGSKASSVDIRSDFRLDLKNSDLSKGYEWLLNKAEDFKRVFRKYL